MADVRAVRRGTGKAGLNHAAIVGPEQAAHERLDVESICPDLRLLAESVGGQSPFPIE